MFAFATPASKLVINVVGTEDCYAEVELTCGTKIRTLIPIAALPAYRQIVHSQNSKKPILTLILIGERYALHSVEDDNILIQNGMSTYIGEKIVEALPRRQLINAIAA